MRLFTRVRSETGAELVEFALVLPMLLLILGGIVDFGMLLQRQQVVTNAAREGARLAAVNYPVGDVQDRVNRFLQEGLNNPSATSPTRVEDVTITLPSGATINAKRVVVTLSSTFLVLGPAVALVGGNNGPFGTISVTATSTMRVENAATGS